MNGRRVVPGAVVVLATALAGAVSVTGSAGASSEPNGEPISIMNISTLESPLLATPQIETAIEARVAAINADGGINGRPIEVEFCNDKFDPNEGSACARSAVDNEVAAVVGGLTTVYASIGPVLEEAGIPWLGGMGASGDVELNSSVSYPFQGGSSAIVLGVGRYLVDEGAESVAIITGDSASTIASGDNYERGIEAGGGTVSRRVSGADGHADWAAEVANALDEDPDAVVLAVQLDDGPKIVRALRQAGFDGPIGAANTILTPAALDALGGDAEGLVLGFRLAPVTTSGNEAIDQFRAEMEAADPDAAIDEISLNAWTAVDLFAALAARVDEVSAESITAALDELDEPIELGTVPDYPPATIEPPHEDWPRIRNFFSVIGEVRDGTVEQVSDFFDPLA